MTVIKWPEISKKKLERKKAVQNHLDERKMIGFLSDFDKILKWLIETYEQELDTFSST